MEGGHGGCNGGEMEGGERAHIVCVCNVFVDIGTAGIAYDNITTQRILNGCIFS